MFRKNTIRKKGFDFFRSFTKEPWPSINCSTFSGVGVMHLQSLRCYMVLHLQTQATRIKTSAPMTLLLLATTPWPNAIRSCDSASIGHDPMAKCNLIRWLCVYQPWPHGQMQSDPMTLRLWATTPWPIAIWSDDSASISHYPMAKCNMLTFLVRLYAEN